MKYFLFLSLLFASLNSIAQKTVKSFGLLYTQKIGAEDFIEISDVVEKGDAKKFGLKSGDRIIEINGIPMATIPNEKIAAEFASSKIKGSVSLKIKDKTAIVVLKPSEIPALICLSGSCTNGFSKQLNNFEMIEYEGGFRNGLYHGEGKITYKSNHAKNGAFTLMRQTGSYLDGVFVTGKTHFFNGYQFDGQIRNGIPFGYGTYKHDQGKIAVGAFDEKGNFSISTNAVETKTNAAVIPTDFFASLSPLLKCLSSVAIKSENSNMNTINSSYINYLEEKYPYLTHEFKLHPDSVFLTDISISQGKLGEMQFYSSGRKEQHVSGSDATGVVMSYNSKRKNDTLTMFAIGMEKMVYDLKYVTLPITRVSDLKKMSFKDRLLLLAFSARFDFGNILTDDDVNLVTETSFDGGLLIDGKVEDNKRAYLNKSGRLSQDLIPTSDDKEKALKVAKDYSKKVAEASNGLPVTVKKCDNRDGTTCEFEDVVYKETYTLKSDLKVDRFKLETRGSDRTVFQIVVQVYVDGGHRPNDYHQQD